MKVSILLATTLLLSASAFAKIVVQNDKLFIESNGNRAQLFAVNNMTEKKQISKVKLFGDGRANIISFAKKGEKEKLYSVDNQGFIYSLQPFAGYEVAKVDDKGHFEFKQVPGRKYHVNEKGFFFY